jgi:tripartite motif-containing protein 71
MRSGRNGTTRGIGFDSIAIASIANVYVVDSNSHCILKLDSNGTFITKGGNYGNGPRQFNGAYDIAIDSSGNVYM